MRYFKGKKKQKYKERFISGNVKYEEAARSLLKPKVGYGLASELRRAGVFVKMVEDKPQSADWALKRQMQHSMSRGIDWMILVTDDSDLVDMLRRAKESNLQTVVVGDSSKALGRYADLWVPWVGVENGEIGEEELFSARTRNDAYSQVDDDGVPNPGVRMSAFSEGEEEEKWVRDESDNVGTNDHVRKYPSLVEKDLFWDSEGEESDEEDGYL
ncbi:C2h2-like zinc finger protein [Thalictrum thalictroides]|uniref:C2h2-like zinc finger protein n=1 Tax=Thalictrum thalictroides TaxID=46969 RepID=A0A7J6W3M2_THATH|nr:C2h2-like zinc finger protein [Thalictrum thalictroides]